MRISGAGIFESRRTPATNARAIEQYKRAIALDPNYALAWSSLASPTPRAPSTATPARSRCGLARAMPPRAPSAPIADLAEAQLAVGYVNWLLDWDWAAAEAAFRRAIRPRSQQRGGAS